DPGVQTDLPPGAPDPVAVEGEALAEADRGDVAELAGVDVVLPGRREVRPTRVGDQRLEEHSARKQAGLPLGQDAGRLQGGRRGCYEAVAPRNGVLYCGTVAR